MENFIRALPKAELHLHIEGTLEPEMMFRLARRNGVDLPFGSVEEVRAAYEFSDLQSFLDIYYQSARVLLKEEDFFELAWDYFKRAADDTVRRAEIFFDPQTHTERGVPFETVLDGLERACRKAEGELGVSCGLILSFLRHLSAEDAERTLDSALPHKGRLLGIGLDSAEKGNPPAKFKAVFDRARGAGLRTVAHAGEEGPADYIVQALDILGVSRVDHGVRCVDDPGLVARLARQGVPLTVCPLSNVKLRVFGSMKDHNLRSLLEAGLAVTINSDDPAFFGGYINANFLAAWKALALSEAELRTLAENSFKASFLDEARKSAHLAEIASLPPSD